MLAFGPACSAISMYLSSTWSSDFLFSGVEFRITPASAPSTFSPAAMTAGFCESRDRGAEQVSWIVLTSHCIVPSWSAAAVPTFTSK